MAESESDLWRKKRLTEISASEGAKLVMRTGLSEESSIGQLLSRSLTRIDCKCVQSGRGISDRAWCCW
jgi:hypothetical protein